MTDWEDREGLAAAVRMAEEEMQPHTTPAFAQMNAEREQGFPDALAETHARLLPKIEEALYDVRPRMVSMTEYRLTCIEAKLGVVLEKLTPATSWLMPAPGEYEVLTKRWRPR